MAQRIIIAGGGLGGLSLALALKQALGAGHEVVLADPVLARPGRTDGRAYAISAAGRRMFAALGVWDAMAGEAQPITDMLVTDSKTRDVVRPGYLTFANSRPDAGADGAPFAHMVWSRVINQVLTESCREVGVALRAVGVRRVTANQDSATVDYTDGERQRAALVVAADGARSRLREGAAIGWVGWDYGQSGIVATVAHERPHGGRAIEHFLPAGPFAVLPLPDDAAMGHQSSIVWTEATSDAETLLSLQPDDLLDELETRFGLQLGALRFASAPKAYPLSFGIARRFIAPRLALLGDAAHVIHPIAGQGLNLGLKDAASLAEAVVDAARLGVDVGTEAALAPYQAARRFDTVAMGVVTDGLNRLFSNDVTPVRLARDLGLGLVDRMPGLKAMFIREASGNSTTQPRLLRGEAV
ncbi:MAG: FAD-dependent monooxygenase [Hyphomicrobiales bacterium]|nr:FAD-dependent monooxygenase [Hyphomicrobiales bacterium]